MTFTPRLVLLGMAFVAAAASAQAPAKKAKPGSAAKPPQVQPEPAPPTPAPFVPVHWDAALPPSAYQQNTPQLVYGWVQDKLKAIPSKIDQFSSTAERAAQELAVKDVMASIAPIAFLVPCTATYDGDKKTFKVSRSASPFYDYMLKSPHAENLKMRKLGWTRRFVSIESPRLSSSGRLIGEHKTTNEEFVLGIPAGPANEPSVIVGKPSINTTRYRDNLLDYITFVPMSQEDAREKHPQMTCMAVLSLQAPYIFKYTEDEVSNYYPKHYTETRGFGVFGKLDRWAVVNKVSGETYVDYTRDGL